MLTRSQTKKLKQKKQQKNWISKNDDKKSKQKIKKIIGKRKFEIKNEANIVNDDCKNSENIEEIPSKKRKVISTKKSVFNFDENSLNNNNNNNNNSNDSNNKDSQFSFDEIITNNDLSDISRSFAVNNNTVSNNGEINDSIGGISGNNDDRTDNNNNSVNNGNNKDGLIFQTNNNIYNGGIYPGPQAPRNLFRGGIPRIRAPNFNDYRYNIPSYAIHTPNFTYPRSIINLPTLPLSLQSYTNGNTKSESLSSKINSNNNTSKDEINNDDLDGIINNNNNNNNDDSKVKTKKKVVRRRRRKKSKNNDNIEVQSPFIQSYVNPIEELELKNNNQVLYIQFCQARSSFYEQYQSKLMSIKQMPLNNCVTIEQKKLNIKRLRIEAKVQEKKAFQHYQKLF